jgi:putative hydrolase of the HAD superfamily
MGDMNKKDTVILLDLGGVLIDLNWLTSAQKLFGNKQSERTLKQKWTRLASVRNFESGKTSLLNFYHEFIDETGYSLPFDLFQKEFASIIGSLKNDCESVLSELKKDFAALAMLSNTNSLHIEKIRKETSLLTYFDSLFFSYELGMVKPDHEIFYEVSKQLDTRPGNIIFFDDNAANIEAARTCGFKAFVVNSPAEISARLKTLDFK